MSGTFESAKPCPTCNRDFVFFKEPTTDEVSKNGQMHTGDCKLFIYDISFDDVFCVICGKQRPTDMRVGLITVPLYIENKADSALKQAELNYRRAKDAVAVSFPRPSSGGAAANSVITPEYLEANGGPLSISGSGLD